MIYLWKAEKRKINKKKRLRIEQYDVSKTIRKKKLINKNTAGTSSV